MGQREKDFTIGVKSSQHGKSRGNCFDGGTCWSLRWCPHSFLEIGLVDPGLVDIYNAFARFQQVYHSYRILLPEDKTSLRVSLHRHTIGLPITQVQLLAEVLADFLSREFKLILFAKDRLDDFGVPDRTIIQKLVLNYQFCGLDFSLF
jgi:hypothetical protein